MITTNIDVQYLGRLFVLVIAVPLLLSACRLTSHEVEFDALPLCSADDSERFNFARSHSFGVIGEPNDLAIGLAPAKKGSAYDWLAPDGNWFPRDGYRHTVCGVMDRYGVFKGAGDELDWNIFLLPSSPYAYSITEAAVCPIDGAQCTPWGCLGLNCDDWHQCSGRTCIEAEATPAKGLEENPWFPVKGSKNSPLEGRKVCVNGPWVSEWLHGLRPEIHPSEMLWWRDSEFTYMLLVQDDSGRFDKRSHFEDPPQSGPWTPWAQPPLASTFRIPFTGFVDRPYGTVSIFSDSSANVIADPEDVTSGRTHGLKVDGNLVLRVSESNRDGDIQVGFENLCRTNSPEKRFFGDITLRSSIGLDTSGNEGYQLAKFAAQWQRLPDDVNPSPDPDPIVDPSLLVVDIELIADELHAVDNQGAIRLEAPARVTITDQRGRNVSFDQARFELGSDRETLEIDSSDSVTRLNSLPLPPGGTITFFDGGKQLVSIDSPGVSFASTGNVMESVIVGNGSDWATIANASEIETMPDQDSTEQLRKVSLVAIPIYGMWSSGYPHIEEETPVSGRLKDALERKSLDEIRHVFGTDAPIAITWELSATDLVTNQPIEIVGSDTIQTEMTTTMVEDDTLSIFFSGAAQRPIQVLVTATLHDSFGTTSKHNFEISNQIVDVSEDGVDGFANMLHKLGLERAAREIRSIAGSGEPPKYKRQPGAYDAGILYTQFNVAARDGMLSPREFGILIETAGELEAED